MVQFANPKATQDLSPQPENSSFSFDRNTIGGAASGSSAFRDAALEAATLLRSQRSRSTTTTPVSLGEGDVEKTLGNNPQRERITVGGVEVRLGADVTQTDISKYLVDKEGKAFLRVNHPDTGNSVDLPILKDTSHIIAHRQGDKLKLSVVDKPGADGTSQISEASIDANGVATLDRHKLVANFKTVLDPALANGTLASAGIEIQKETGRIKVGDKLIGITEGTERVEIADGIGEITLRIYDKPSPDGKVSLTTIKVEKGTQEVSEPKVEELRPRPRIGEALDDFRSANVTEIFNRGFNAANEYAKTKGYELSFAGSGVLVRGLGTPSVNPIEIQTVFARDLKTGERVEIGSVLPEKDHLRTLHSSGEIASQMKKLLDDYMQ